jgi:hypothetical protein
MVVRQAQAIVLAFGLMAFGGCSKTQDTAPETRIFGSPPAIQSVDVQTGSTALTCDITAFVKVFLCDFGLHPGMYSFIGNTVDVNIHYSETMVKAHIVDAENTPPTSNSDILLATTSYQPPPATGQVPEEISLLMFDDGQANKFPYQAQVAGDLVITNPNTGDCAGNAGTYDLTTNDQTADDHTFTRGFGFVAPAQGVGSRSLALLGDCVAKTNHQFPTINSKDVGKSFTLKIEVVDREGNLTAWPVQPVVTPTPSTFSCADATDPCACCLMSFESGDFSICKNLPGLIITDPAAGFPVGLGFCTNL